MHACMPVRDVGAPPGHATKGKRPQTLQTWWRRWWHEASVPDALRSACMCAHKRERPAMRCSPCSRQQSPSGVEIKQLGAERGPACPAGLRTAKRCSTECMHDHRQHRPGHQHATATSVAQCGCSCQACMGPRARSARWCRCRMKNGNNVKHACSACRLPTRPCACRVGGVVCVHDAPAPIQRACMQQAGCMDGWMPAYPGPAAWRHVRACICSMQRAAAGAWAHMPPSSSTSHLTAHTWEAWIILGEWSC